MNFFKIDTKILVKKSELFENLKGKTTPGEPNSRNQLLKKTQFIDIVKL